MGRNSLRTWPLMVLLGVLLPTMSGCKDMGPARPQVTPNFNPPLDAQTLSGGKITHYTPTPGLPADPAAKTFLMACRQIRLDSSQARSAFVVIKTGKFGRFEISALVVGSKVLVLPTDLVTMGIQSGGSGDELSLYPLSAQSITFSSGSKRAKVGNNDVLLSLPVVRADHQFIMTLPDLLKVFRERDRQRHQPPFIHSVRIIYNLRDE